MDAVLDADKVASIVHYWGNGFLQLSSSLHLRSRRIPLRRLAVTVLLAFDKPFTLVMQDGAVVSARAVVLAPGLAWHSLSAIDSELAILDFNVATPFSQAFDALLTAAPLHVLDEALLPRLSDVLVQARDTSLDKTTLTALLVSSVCILTGRRPRKLQLHPRIAHALRLIEANPMSAVSLPWLAEQVYLSTSRFRHLFRSEMGCNLTHYLRWNGLWKGIAAWSRGRPLMIAAEAGGFYDLAHFNRTFNEAFGVSPSDISRNPHLCLVRHELP